jgi:chromosome segregation ATPase
MKETSRIKSSFIHATRGGWEQLSLLKDQLLESQEKLLKAYKELIALEEEKKVREAALVEAREASRKATEEALLLRERALTVEEAASKAREEVLSYKNVVADLDKEKGLLKTDLDSIRESFRRIKVEYVDSEVARGAAEDAKKKALEDLEAERVRSYSLSNDVDRLKGELLEKNGAIAQAGKAIEDLQVANTELACSNREIERSNTKLVGENTSLEDSIRGTFLLSDFLFEVYLVYSKVFALAFTRLKDELLAAQVEAHNA